MEDPQASTSKGKRPKRSNDARFPVARIKKLIQADEEVGKVAQATPVVVSKALELFLKDLVDHLVSESQSRQTQKITAHSLKRVINSTPTFDFLIDLVKDVPDPTTTSGDNGEEPKKPVQRSRRTKKEAGGGGGVDLDSFGGEEDDGEGAGEGAGEGDDDDYDE